MNHPPLPVHVEVEDFPVKDNCLVIGGRTVADLAVGVGQTPFYVYDSKLIAKRINALRESFPDKLKLHYAVKANPMPAVVNFIAPKVDGLDVASASEMHVALGSGMPANDISFAGPGKRPQELEQAVAMGVTVTIESVTEMRRLADIGRNIKREPQVAIRVNPDFELRSSGMKMSGGPKPFGIDAEIVPDVLRELATLPMHFNGFHIFCGSQNLNAESIIDAQSKTVDLALRLTEYAPRSPNFINIGGGLGIPYFKGDNLLSLEPIGDNLKKLTKLASNALPDTSLVVELGRYIIGEAGLYVCRVIDRKESRGVTYLITDGGLHHHLAASGNFGQIIRKNYPVVVGTKVFSDDLEPQSVVGPLCTPLDILADKMPLPRAEIDDLIVVFQSGAYGLTASPLNFLSHPYPAELLV